MQPNRTMGDVFHCLTSGQIVPNRFPQTWLRWYIPRRRISFRTAGSCQSKVHPHRRFCGGLPLTEGPGCSISQRRGGWIGLNTYRGLTMNFMNSPYEHMMKSVPLTKTTTPQKAPEGAPCAGCSYWRGIACVFCHQELLKKQG